MGEMIAAERQLPETASVLVDEPSQYLTFHVGEERYAISILDVKEIIEVGVMTRVPMTPDFIQGVINLRGNVVPVVDLAARLGRGRSDLSKRSCIVLVELESDNEGQTAGMLVDEVNEILEIPESDMQPAPEFGTDIRTEFIQRMGRVDDAFIVLLDINHVLSVSELAELMQRRKGRKSSLPSETATGE